MRNNEEDLSKQDRKETTARRIRTGVVELRSLCPRCILVVTSGSNLEVNNVIITNSRGNLADERGLTRVFHSAGGVRGAKEDSDQLASTIDTKVASKDGEQTGACNRRTLNSSDSGT